MRRLLLLSPLVLALALGSCDDKTKPAQTGPGGEVKTPASPQPGPPTPDDPPSDGGAEQPSSEPIPPAPGPPAQPPSPPAPSPATFAHEPAGAIPAGQGSGYLDRTVWSPAMCWPLQDDAFANSQVYGHGGGKGPAGTGQCDQANYSLPWRDTFCEARSRDNPLCAGGGTGHQGQDIRPAACKKNQYWAVAAETGVITDIGSYTVTLTASAAPHRVYRYLHMQMAALAVKEGDTVAAGQKLGKVSNDFGGTPTTIHLHFELRAGAAGATTDGKPVVLHTFLPPYMSLAEAYQRKLNGGTCGG
ncbi:M23 family metallopeptidase [Caulobacter sp. UNC279MFTsu5.1]|uniref:M23 family metallopeptidase n=1 Tax=Caulobacter sp. UNC279MFTsu5.1 TaxID=1502775 RepID=UPI0008E7BB33|nr:M23 family metallopeptidase [Caulobacter sp. UNC279MFTsu5.1]SFK63491.1 Peptidase family M23 [Caulobacter sp. UNC279MFTsu5.1]